MIEDLATLIEVSQSGMIVAVIVFLRVGALMALLPAFGEMMVPVRVKLAITVCFVMIVGPAVAPIVAPIGIQGSDLVAIGLTEVLVGLALGLALRLFIFALQIAGTVAAQSTSLSQIFGGQAVDPQPAIGVILVIAGLALVTFFDFHTRVAMMLVSTYQMMPPGMIFPTGTMTDWAVNAIGQAFRLAVVLAMPFVLASLLYNLALGVINRAMPQLMVAFVGAPAITFGALFLLAMTAPFILSIWVSLLNERVADPFGVF